MAEHRWTLVVLVDLSEKGAAALNAMDVADRLEHLHQLVPAPARGESTPVRQVRGPICADCRVHWRDVHASAMPWPCPGKRPEVLGGPLVAPQPTLTRQERRRQQRQAGAVVERAKRAETAEQALKHRADVAVLTSRALTHAHKERARRDALAAPEPIEFADPLPCRPQNYKLEPLVPAGAVSTSTDRSTTTLRPRR